MIFITGADNNPNKHNFEEDAIEWQECIEQFGYKTAIYNLGGLSIPAIQGFEVTDPNFILSGTYNCDDEWATTGKHKPRLIRDAFDRFPEEDIIAYLDVDGRLQMPIFIDAINNDIVVVEREPHEDLDRNALKELLRGDYNAGVGFFANRLQVKSFVDEWIIETEKMQNDQAALSYLLRKSGLRILVLPVEYNQSKLKDETIILHKTGGKKYGKIYREQRKNCSYIK